MRKRKPRTFKKRGKETKKKKQQETAKGVLHAKNISRKGERLGENSLGKNDSLILKVISVGGKKREKGKNLEERIHARATKGSRVEESTKTGEGLFGPQGVWKF